MMTWLKPRPSPVGNGAPKAKGACASLDLAQACERLERASASLTIVVGEALKGLRRPTPAVRKVASPR